MTTIIADLEVEAIPDAPIGAATWYGIGGRADLLVKPRSIEALSMILKRGHRSGTPIRVLGNGANLLVADEGVDGLVVKLDAPCFKDVRYNTRGDVSSMRAMAGADLPQTLMDTVRRGLSGLAPMAGVPASIGGAVRMNAGGAFGAIGDVVDEVSCVTRTGDVVTYPANELRFEYRRTNIPDPVITSATLRLQEDDPVALRDRVKEIFAFKKSTQPLADHSAGCTFRNPFDPVEETYVPAGRLIDQAGLKGERVGNAVVSTQHANFIVTEAGASAQDVITLLERVRVRVREHSGFDLENEVVVWRRGDPA